MSFIEWVFHETVSFLVMPFPLFGVIILIGIIAVQSRKISKMHNELIEKAREAEKREAEFSRVVSANHVFAQLLLRPIAVNLTMTVNRPDYADDSIDASDSSQTDPSGSKKKPLDS